MTGARRRSHGNPEVLRDVITPMRPRLHRGTVLRLPRQDYYRYLFGFRIMPLGSWPLSSSYDVFYFCRKSLTCLERAGVGVVTQVLGFAAFHVRRSRGPRCALGCTGVLGSFDSILRNWHVSYDAPCIRVSVGPSQSFSQQEPGVRCPARGLNDFSQPASPEQDIAPVILLSRVLLRSGPCSNLEENKFPRDRPGSSRLVLSGCARPDGETFEASVGINVGLSVAGPLPLA
ncbi:hypothetical protein YC2023_017836 [Brassica napus]